MEEDYLINIVKGIKGTLPQEFCIGDVVLKGD